jgi:hypothetical protein
MDDKDFPSVNPNNWGPFAHLPDLLTDKVTDLLNVELNDREQLNLAFKELVIYVARLEIRIADHIAYVNNAQLSEEE